MGASDDDKENKYTEYQAKLATLDLEIALTQNLFQSLSQAVAKGGSPIRKYIFYNEDRWKISTRKQVKVQVEARGCLKGITILMEM